MFPNACEVGGLGYGCGWPYYVFMYLQITSKDFSPLEGLQFDLDLFQHLTWL